MILMIYIVSRPWQNILSLFFFFFFFSFLMCLILLIAEGQVRIVSAIVIIRVIVCTNKKLASNKNYGTRMDAPSDV